MQATSFEEYYERFTGGSGGNANAAGFNKVMNSTTRLKDQCKALDNPDRVILISNTANQVRIIHGLKNFGNSIVRPKTKICGHIGMGHLAFLGTIDHAEVLSSISFKIQKSEIITACNTMDELSKLTSPPAQTQGRQRNNHDEGIESFSCTKDFVLIPFIQRALIESGATCPLKLILKGLEAYSEHCTTLVEDNPIIEEVNSHTELLEKWLMGVHLGKVLASTYFEANPDDTDLLKFSKLYHQAQIDSLQGRNEGRGQATTTKRG
jgi:hypothetical protein